MSLKEIIMSTNQSRSVRPNLIAFGNVLLDFSFAIESDVDILQRFQLKPDDLGECSTAKLGEIRTEALQTCKFLKTQTGGSALNTMKILRILGEERGLFCGSIGDDENGEIVQANLRECGLDARLQVHPTIPTGTCVCLLKNEYRCCYANIGASARFHVDSFKSNMPDILGPHRQIFYIEGFFITENRFQMAQHICDCEMFLAINLSASYIIANNPSQMKYLAEKSRIVFGNLGEFQQLTELYGFEELAVTEQYLLRNSEKHKKLKILVCTNGGGSVRYACYDPSMNFPTFSQEFKFDPVPSDKIVDTTGCGDAFVAGFFYAFLQRHSVADCVRKGVEVASNKLQNIGGII